MTLETSASRLRLDEYLARVGTLLGNDERRASFATYAMGILSDAERKSVEPLSARATPEPGRADAAHQRLLHFLSESRWDDQAVRREAAKVALAQLVAREPIEAWIMDDTGFLKQGTHSVGVQRQYTGTAGKVTNCQVGVSLAVCTRSDHLPLDFELYLPTTWTDEPARRAEARIPKEVTFQTKPELALQMIRRAVDSGVPRGLVLGDAGYGSSSDLRRELRKLELDYAVSVNPEIKVRVRQATGSRWGPPRSLRHLATKLDKERAFKRCTWREGTKKELSARFATQRVQVSAEEEVTLLVEWRDREVEPANYYLISMPPQPSMKELVRMVMQRWRIERTYEDMKGELGLDHYEGRRFPGWHHHVSVVLCCYAFVVAERARRFPPSARWSAAHVKDSLSSGAPLSQQLHHCPACALSGHLDLASSVSELPPPTSPLTQ